MYFWLLHPPYAQKDIKLLKLRKTNHTKTPKTNRQVIIDYSWISEYIKTRSVFNVNIDFNPNRINAYGYYVYALIDPFTGEIFYIGKGKEKRAHDHLKLLESDCNKGKKDRILSIFDKEEKPIIWILEDNMEESRSLDLESAIINTINFGLTNILIPEMRESNNYLQNMNVDTTKEDAHVSVCKVDPITFTLEELREEMAIIISNGERAYDGRHVYLFQGTLYDYDNVIHIMPLRFREKKSNFENVTNSIFNVYFKEAV